jgi:hypothetical protein
MGTLAGTDVLDAAVRSPASGKLVREAIRVLINGAGGLSPCGVASRGSAITPASIQILKIRIL